jgi:hypothetical protein
MTWDLSRFRAGDLVEVRSKEEILATVDNRGCLQGMPFMPEMLQYCGQRFRVAAVAHKTCDMLERPGSLRRLRSTVHLAGVRCDGSAHDGCEAECNLYWNDAWLKPAEDEGGGRTDSVVVIRATGGGFTESQLVESTRAIPSEGGVGLRYSCQATQISGASQPLAWWDVRQYLFDVLTRNRSAGRVLRVLFLASLRSLLPRVPFGYRFFKAFHDRMHLQFTGRESPSPWGGHVPDGVPTPTGRLGLQPDEYVRIKAQTDIEHTIDRVGRNRGLTFDPEEMAPYCGRVVKVRKSVTKIVDERTGKMLSMKQPCIMLEGVVCNSEYARGRLNCPRAFPSYWREIWLERIENDASPAPGGKNARKA